MHIRDAIDLIKWGFAAIVAAVILWQVWTGKVTDREGKVRLPRDEETLTYWYTIFMECLFLAIVILLNIINW